MLADKKLISGGESCQPKPQTLKERVLAWRDRIVMRPQFRAWAARFPLTRPIARRQSAALFDLATGFVKSQTLLACVRLKILESLAEAPKTAASLAHGAGLPLEAMDRLLLAAKAVDLVADAAGGRYRLGPFGAAVVGDAGIRAMVEHNATFYEDLKDPVALLRGEVTPTRLQAYWSYVNAGDPAGLPGESVGDYSRLMAESQRMVAAEVLSVFPMNNFRCLLDVGGGEGVFAAEAGRAAPHLQLRVFDLPPVVSLAARHMHREGLAARFEGIGGDFFEDRLPGEADLVSLVRILHDHDDDKVLKLLENIRRSMARGTTLLIAEPMADVPGARASGAYFAFYLLAMGSGRPRTPATLINMLEQTGFSNARVVQTNTPVITQVITATA
jgi:demethylspheroidene O-methyltransferase